VSFPGFGGHDEGPHARLVASHFGTTHTELVAEPASVDLLPQLARQFDEPIGDSSLVPEYLVSRLVRESCTVALGGDGGDELFGGYRTYSYMLRHEQLRAVTPPMLRRAVSWAGERMPAGVRGRNYLVAMDQNRSSAVSRMRLFLDAAARLRLCPALAAVDIGAPEQRMDGAATGGATLLQRLTRADFLTYLPDDILVKVDRASMLASLEMRAPFLDHRLIEFAFASVPDSLRATPRDSKVLLRRLGARMLPPALDLERKQGFSLPLQAWFRGEWGNFMRDTLRGSDGRLFNAREVERLIASQERGLANTARLFALTMLELWRREYHIDVPAQRPAARAG